MIYLDSNIFLNAILNASEKGERARSLLREVQSGKESAITSALTYDEVFWAVKKFRSFEDALRNTKAMLETPGLAFSAMDIATLHSAWGFSDKYKLNPRDAIHVASAILRGVNVVVSEDEDFDRVKESLSKKSTE